MLHQFTPLFSKVIKSIHKHIGNALNGSMMVENRDLDFPPKIDNDDLIFANQKEITLMPYTQILVNAEFHVEVTYHRVHYSYCVSKNIDIDQFCNIKIDGGRHHCPISNACVEVLIYNAGPETIVMPAGTYLFEIMMNDPDWQPNIYLTKNPKDFTL